MIAARVSQGLQVDPRVCHIPLCMKPNVIVWDLETVPDLGRFAGANDLVGKRDEDPTRQVNQTACRRKSSDLI
jgi:hypothetical protein